MSIETRISRLVKKTGVQKSRWTVPLKLDPDYFHTTVNIIRRNWKLIDYPFKPVFLEK
jgi:hypothetical protein